MQLFASRDLKGSNAITIWYFRPLFDGRVFMGADTCQVHSQMRPTEFFSIYGIELEKGNWIEFNGTIPAPKKG